MLIGYRYKITWLILAELDPNSYLNYYKRATVYLSLGKHNAALDDFDSILRLNPTFAQVWRSSLEDGMLTSQAHLQKAKILTKEGRFEDARSELKEYRKSKQDAESEELVGLSCFATLTF